MKKNWLPMLRRLQGKILSLITSVPAGRELVFRLRLVFKSESYINQMGWAQSVRARAPVDAKNRPLPWFNYPMIQLLQERLSKEHRVFEYGSGYSTLFLSKHAGEVTSVESHREWYESLRQRLPSNVKLIYQEFEAEKSFARSILEQPSEFDLVIIDGLDQRLEAAQTCIEKLSADGVILLDDSHFEEFQEAFHFLENQDFKSLTLGGLKPCGIRPEQTTLFYRPNNILGL